MADHAIAEYKNVYLNSDGTFVDGFKAEDDALAFREYPNGDRILWLEE